MKNQYRILKASVLRSIEAKDWESLLNTDWPDYELCSSEIADTFDYLNSQEQTDFFLVLPGKLKTEVLSQLTPHIRDSFFISLKKEIKAEVLNHMDPDDLSEFIQELGGPGADEMMNLLLPHEKGEAEELLHYPLESVGRMMTPDYMSIREDWTIQEVLEYIRSCGEDRETLSTLYVCDKQDVLLDAISLNSIVLAAPESAVHDLMDFTVLTIMPEDDRELAVKLMQKYDRLVLPVVDKQSRLLGIVTIDDVMDIARDEATEDFHLQAALKPLGKGYWDTRISGLLKSRLPWLTVLVVLNLVSSGIIASFEESLALYIGLAFFIPLLIDTGGNSGSQSAMMMIRALSTGDVKADQWGKIVLRELVCGIFIGLVLGLMGALLAYFRGGMDLALVLFISLFLILIITNLTGVVLPFILSALKIDPAVASGPLITTVSDAAGLLIYFQTARFFLRI